MNGVPGARLTKDLLCHDSKISQFVQLLTPREIHILRCMGSQFSVKFETFQISHIILSPYTAK